MRIFIGILVFLATLPALSQGTFPSRPITFVVPYAPGGAADIVARPLAVALTKELKQSVVVVNPAGASGAIGTRMVATAVPDGHTLLIAAVQMSILPEVDKLFGRPPSYQIEDFVGIARLTADPVIFLVAANSTRKTMSDILEAARQQPGKLSYSSGGVYSGIHLPFEVLAQQANVKLLHVPYKGGGPAMAAMLTGEVEMTAQVPGVAYGHLSSGKFRALAHSGVGRLPDLPGIPSLKEEGYDVEFYLWVGLFAARAVPSAVTAQIESAVSRAMKSAEVETFASGMKTRLAFQNRVDFNSWWKADAAQLIKTVQKIGKVE